MDRLDTIRLPPELLVTAAVAAFALAAAVVWIGRRFVNRVAAALEDAGESQAAVRRRSRQVVGALAIVAFGVAGVTTLSLALSRAGFDVPEWTPRQVVSWLMSRGVRVLIILAGAYITLRGGHLAIEAFQARASSHVDSERAADRRRRAATLGSIVSSALTALVCFLATLMVLRELSIDVLPLLTGAGLAGLAVGFGAQNLVRDVISGFFLILEDHVGVGDVARIQSVTGVVEQIRLRSLVLRDADGAVHVFPNGTITTLANLSKDFGYAVVDIVVPHGESIDRAAAALRTIGATLEGDPAINAALRGPVEILGVQELRETGVVLRARVRTVPHEQARVASEFRRQVATGFAALGIRPFSAG